MTPEMIKDPHYTIELRNADRSETLASLLGKMENEIGKTSNRAVYEALTYFISEAENELNDRYQKRKK